MDIKRVYEPVSREDGKRFLVERLWPRGVRKADLPLAGWCKEAAPSGELRKWFHADPESRWEEFRRRYLAELKANPEAWQPLCEAAAHGPVTLLYSAHDEAHNSAVVLREFLAGHGKKSAPAQP